MTIDVGGGEAESGKWGAYDPLATDDGRDCQLCAFLVTGVIGNNNAIRWTARHPGVGGRAISVTLTDPGGADQALSVTVTTQTDGTVDIDFSLATDGASAITTTPAQLIAFLAARAATADADADDLITASNESTSTGAAAVVAAALAQLGGDRNNVEIGVLSKDVNVHFGDVAWGIFTGGAVFRASQLTGYAGNEANLDAAFQAQGCRVEAVTDLA